MGKRPKKPSKSEKDREALRDLTEEQLFEDIAKLPEYISEMKRLQIENRKQATQIRNGDRLLQVRMDRINELEEENRRLKRATKPAEGPVPVPPPQPPDNGSFLGGPEPGISGEPFSCKKCASKIMFIVTEKNRKRAVVEAHGVKGRRVSHRMRTAVSSAWGFDAKGVYTTVQTDVDPHEMNCEVYEYHNCGERDR